MTRHRTFTGPALHIARSNRAAGIPTGALIPTVPGEFYLNSSTTPESLWIATGLTATDWLQLTGPGVLTAAAGQLISYPTHFHPELTPVLFTRSSILHYAGFSLVDTRHDGNIMGSIFPIFTREQDTTTSNRTTSVQFQVDSGGVGTWEQSLHCVIPQGFSQFGSAGLVLRHRFSWDITTVAETSTLTIEAYDPNNAAEVVGASAVRNIDGTTTDAGYVELAITQANLNAVGFVAGQMLRLRIIGVKTAGASFVRHRLGRILVDFE